MKLVNLSIAAAAACMFATSAHALKTGDRVLKGNYVVEYTKVPGSVNSIGDMFAQGEVYGRLRSHLFMYDWDNEITRTGTGAINNNNSTRDNRSWGLGGSVVAKTGFYNGFGATLGFFGTNEVLSDNTITGSASNFGRTGKDTYRQRANGTEANIGVFAEAFLEYKTGKTNVKVGRQGIESVMLATNDTKMVPNTFEAAVVENSDIDNTKLRAAYITAQKLRDHQVFHSTIAFEGREQNDDSGVHRGLTARNINTRGNGDIDPHMFLLTGQNSSIPNLKLDGEYVRVEGFVSTAIAEANYKIKLSDAWSLTPGVRYLRQMDQGAGHIGGAAISGQLGARGNGTNTGTGNARARVGAAGGYKDAQNADGSIIMARLVAANGPLEILLGYSKVSDQADIIAPWRGFPTGGYTRSMAIIDWIANTESGMVKVIYDFDKAGVVPGLLVAADYEKMNFDDAKTKTSGVSDREIYHIDITQTLKAVPNTEFKLRLATVNAELAPAAFPTGSSYSEARFEINYLF